MKTPIICGIRVCAGVRLMSVTCPRCHRTLTSSDAGDAPSFCMFCGQRLEGLNVGSGASPATPEGMHTRSFLPAGSLADSEGDVSIAPEPAPKTIGGYRLLRLLGSGGMGTVYEAEGQGSGRGVAVKLLSSRLASSATSVERFRQEGLLASQLSHPRCVFVIAADTDGGRPYIVMELMPGETLKDTIDKHGPMKPEEAITRMLDVLEGLAESHRVGMIHRDMKPSNCFLTSDNRVKVGDFGLSKSLIVARNNHLTQSGAFLGTVLFASPEQIRGEPLDYRADVYSACATLYYLLCGEAPYHHESVTAALAKAISEDPPPIRNKCPEVSRALEVVVMKGLDRDRERRWQTAEDFRDALLALLPSRQHPARPRALIGAYVLDRIFLLFVTVPLELFRMWASGVHDGNIDLFELRWIPILALLAYFTIGEGLFGATPGKWLLGLRVSRLGQTSPPGLVPALIRTTVFLVLLLSIFLMPEKLVEWLGSTAGGILGSLSMLVASTILLLQLRKKWGYRGLHDLASGCHVTQKPLPSRKLRLSIAQPTPIQSLLPAPEQALPEVVAGYAIRGRVSVQASGEQVWMAEDRALGRAVLIWFVPCEGPEEPVPLDVFRPTRLRRLGSGSLGWNGQRLAWNAYAAPLGGPLSDAINPSRPLPWADARMILEQLVEEFRAGEADGSLPEKMSLECVWAEPSGRLQLVECAFSGDECTNTSPMMLLRQVASLILEGQPRSAPGPVQAPLPSHAVPVLNRLFTDGGYASLGEFQQELADTHAHRPEVTPAVRAAQLGIQAMILSPVLAIMFILAALTGTIYTARTQIRVDQAEAAIAALADPKKHEQLAQHSMLATAITNPRLLMRLTDYRDRMRAETEKRRALLLRPQRIVLEQREEHAPDSEEREARYPIQVRELIQWAGAPENSPRGLSTSPWRINSLELYIVLLAIPLGLMVVAGVLRGGFSMLLAGIALVQSDGQRANRRQCALRAALVWAPITLLLLGAVALQIYAPHQIYLAAGFWLLAVALLPVYIMIALRFPTRPPQDRIAGTYLVPA